LTNVLALDVAILPPPEVADRAIRLSEALPAAESHGLTLGGDYLPHITLTQQFVHVDELDAIYQRVDELLRGHSPLSLTVTGGVRAGSAVWMEVEKSPAIVQLHERLMETLRGFEQAGGTAAAFVEADARIGDVVWVTGYRLKSALHAYTPHITLGHAKRPPDVERFTFEATTVAACHLGRFCSCRRVLRRWELGRGI
jgi:2'-5' RNA ligase